MEIHLQAVKQVKQGKLSATEICEKCIERASKIRELNAFITETSSVARQQLEASRQNKPTGITLEVFNMYCKCSYYTSLIMTMVIQLTPFIFA